jgi:hypothetical protein
MNEEKMNEVKVKAKQILDGFSKKLEGVKLHEKEFKKNVGGFRIEGKGKEGDKEFRERMFDNAPEKSGDFIIAESKIWQ